MPGKNIRKHKIKNESNLESNIEMKTEKDYNEAKKKRGQLSKEIEKLDKKILKYENDNKLHEFYKIEDVRTFIMYDSSEGSVFTFEDVSYKTEDYQYMEIEYGYESMQDCVYGATIKQLEDDYGLIQKIDE